MLLARLRASLDGESRVVAHRTVIDLGRDVAAVTGSEDAADVVSALVELAAIAARAGEVDAARRALFYVLALAVGDPYEWLLERGGTSPFCPDPARAAAHRALESEISAVSALAHELVGPGDPSGPECEAEAEAEIETETETQVCALRPRTGLANAARLLCSFAGPEARAALAPELRERLANDERDWWRGRALLWTDEPLERAAELIARDAAEPPLVRAAAILRAVVDDLAREQAPRTEVLALLAEVVAPEHSAWGHQWAPPALFAELGDRFELALLSPSARVRYGESRPARVLFVTRALLAALDVFPDQHRQRAALAGNLVGFALGERAAPWPEERARDLIVPTVQELSPLEHEILDAVARKVSPLEWDYDVHHHLFELGLPASNTGVRRWLTLDPPGPMSKAVDVRDQGQAQSLPLDLAVQRMLVGRVEASELARAMAAAFSPSELLYATCEAFYGWDARLHCTGPVQDDAGVAAILEGLGFAALEARGSDVMVPVILERLDRILDGFPSELRMGSLLMFLRALSRMLDAGARIPERFDGLVATLPHSYNVDPKSVREVLGHLPQQRLDRLLHHAEERRGSMGANEDYSDLVSEEMRASLVKLAKRPPTKLDELGRTLLDLVQAVVPAGRALPDE